MKIDLISNSLSYPLNVSENFHRLENILLAVKINSHFLWNSKKYAELSGSCKGNVHACLSSAEANNTFELKRLRHWFYETLLLIPQAKLSSWKPLENIICLPKRLPPGFFPWGHPSGSHYKARSESLSVSKPSVKNTNLQALYFTVHVVSHAEPFWRLTLREIISSR